MQAPRPAENMNRWCFNAMFAGALAAGMLAAPAIGSAAIGAVAVGAVAAERPQAPTSVAGHAPTAQPALASVPGHAPTAQPALTSAPGHAPVGDAMANIDACVARLDPQLDIGYDRIAARCPDLMRQLEAGAWAPWLPHGWKESGNDLSAGSLKELRELVARESNTRESSLAKVPDVRSLQPILATLAGNRDETGWSRFKSWLRSLLERREQPTDESWFSRMVSHVGISQSVIRIVTYAALAVVVIMAGIIVVNELRSAGLFGRRRRAARKRRSRNTGATSGLSWSDIEQAQLRDRPRMLLDLIIRRLTDHGSLPPAGALTVRELTRAARLPEAADRSRLEELALAAERVRFSRAELQAEGLEESVAGGRVLLDRLEADGGLRTNTRGLHASAPG